jgi:hypothetical protein
MLVVKIYDSGNKEQIGKICIQNIGKPASSKLIPSHNSLRNYKIRFPANYDETIIHNREDGWEILLEKALKVINKTNTYDKIIHSIERRNK